MFSTSSVPCSDFSQAGKIVASKLFKKKIKKLFKRTAERERLCLPAHQAPVELLNKRRRGRGAQG